ncbi:MAG: hypothetical protein K0S76_1410 [Herbinix sp.]|jgi:UDP-N-acetylmuramyl pentapeptide phosphotransferase/UDP-N-acetylglucosamine-1-phosphate transferase|nr:hypothetical protein [Herbinix sp.]
MKTHRVGTLTFGGMLIVFGLLFLLRIFLPNLSYDIIFKLWPVVFIFLGIEVLAANFKLKEDNKMVYDKTAFALIILLSFFAMGMAVTEFCIEYAASQMTVNF